METDLPGNDTPARVVTSSQANRNAISDSNTSFSAESFSKIENLGPLTNSDKYVSNDGAKFAQLRSRGRFVFKLSLFYKYLYLLEREDVFLSSAVSRGYNFLLTNPSRLHYLLFSWCSCASAWVAKLFTAPVTAVMDLTSSIFAQSSEKFNNTSTSSSLNLHEIGNHEPLSELSCIMRDVSELLSPDSEVRVDCLYIFPPLSFDLFIRIV
jgi:hypothetical protein